MAATKEAFSSLDACKGPPILMGDDSLVEITDKEIFINMFEDIWNYRILFYI